MQQGLIYSALVDRRYVLKFVGDVRLTLCATLDSHLESILSDSTVHEVLVDLTETQAIDSTSLGLIAKLSIRSQNNGLPKPALVSTQEDITRILYTMGFDHLFLLLESLPDNVEDLQQLPVVQESVDDMRHRIIASHRILMDLNDTNRDAFKDLVDTLESIQEK